MFKITIRYVLAVTAVMAVRLAVHQIPPPPPVIVVNGEPISEPSPIRLNHILTWWPIHFGTFFAGISTLMHMLTSIAGLTGWRQWLTAICVPTFALTAWYAYTVRYLNHHSGSLDGWGHVQLGLIGFTIGFAVVTWAVALLGISANQQAPGTPNITESSLPSGNVR